MAKCDSCPFGTCDRQITDVCDRIETISERIRNLESEMSSMHPAVGAIPLDEDDVQGLSFFEHLRGVELRGAVAYLEDERSRYAKLRDYHLGISDPKEDLLSELLGQK